MILRVTDGTNTVELVGTDKRLTRYMPSPEGASRRSFRGGKSKPSVKESGEFFWQTSNSTTRNDTRQLTRLLKQAERAQKDDNVPEVFLEFQPDGDTDVYESELYGGTVRWEESTFGDVDWTIGHYHISVEWEREPGFDGPEETISDFFSNKGPGFNLAFTWDGDMPTPLELEIFGSSTPPAKRIFVGLNKYADNSYQKVYEAEGADFILAGATSDADSVSFVEDFSAHGSLGTQLLGWDITAAEASKLGGNHFHPIIGFMDRASDSFQVQWRVFVDGNELERSEWAELEESSAGMEKVSRTTVVQLPPSLAGFTSLEAFTLELWGRDLAGNTITFDIDCIILMPTDEWVTYQILGGGLPTGDALWHNPDLGVYTEDGTSGNKRGNVVAEGGPIMIEPNMTQALVMVQVPDSTYSPGDSYTVNVTSKPKRETL